MENKKIKKTNNFLSYSAKKIKFFLNNFFKNYPTFWTDLRKELYHRLVGQMVAMVTIILGFGIVILVNLAGTYDTLMNWMKKVNENKEVIKKPEPVSIDFKYFVYFIIGIICMTLIVYIIRFIIKYRNSIKKDENKILDLLENCINNSLDESFLNPIQDELSIVSRKNT